MNKVHPFLLAALMVLTAACGKDPDEEGFLTTLEGSVWVDKTDSNQFWGFFGYTVRPVCD